jgi:hypothetical protein
MPYRVIKIDLSAISAEKEIAPASTNIEEVFVLDIPLGNQFGLKIGRNADFMTITRPFSMEPRGEQESNFGMSYKNDVAQPGVIVEVVVVTGGQLSPVV